MGGILQVVARRKTTKLGFCDPGVPQLGALTVPFHAVTADIAHYDIFLGVPFTNEYEPWPRQSQQQVILHPKQGFPVKLPLRPDKSRPTPTLCSYVEFVDEAPEAEEIFVGFVRLFKESKPPSLIPI